MFELMPVSELNLSSCKLNICALALARWCKKVYYMVENLLRVNCKRFHSLCEWQAILYIVDIACHYMTIPEQLFLFFSSFLLSSPAHLLKRFLSISILRSIPSGKEATYSYSYCSCTYTSG